jgi:hypothetical protein
MPNTQHDVFRVKASTGARWTFLCDAELEVQRHFDSNEYTDVHHDYAAVPHTLIVAPGLVIDKVYVGYWFWGRPSNDQLWADLGDLHRRIKADFDPPRRWCARPGTRASRSERRPAEPLGSVVVFVERRR